VLVAFKTVVIVSVCLVMCIKLVHLFPIHSPFLTGVNLTSCVYFVHKHPLVFIIILQVRK
jgi:hypothetical protein